MVAVRWPAAIKVHVVLPHPGTFPNGPGIASPEGSRGRVTYSRQRLPCSTPGLVAPATLVVAELAILPGNIGLKKSDYLGC